MFEWKLARGYFTFVYLLYIWCFLSSILSRALSSFRSLLTLWKGQRPTQCQPSQTWEVPGRTSYSDSDGESQSTIWSIFIVSVETSSVLQRLVPPECYINSTSQAWLCCRWRTVLVCFQCPLKETGTNTSWHNQVHLIPRSCSVHPVRYRS